MKKSPKSQSAERIDSVDTPPVRIEHKNLTYVTISRHSQGWEAARVLH
jgi:hypothetical protein